MVKDQVSLLASTGIPACRQAGNLQSKFSVVKIEMPAFALCASAGDVAGPDSNPPAGGPLGYESTFFKRSSKNLNE